MRLIDADALIKWVQQCGARCPTVCVEKVFNKIKDAPTIDAVPVGAYEQTRWERDTAIAQLAEIGKSLCEKMDNVATVVRCKDCKYNYGKEHGGKFNPEDIVCDYWATDGLNADDFCSYGERSEDER